MKMLLMILSSMLLLSCTTSVKHVKPVTGKIYPVVEPVNDMTAPVVESVTNTSEPLNMFVVMVIAVVASCACCVFYTRAVDRKCHRQDRTDDSDETTVING